MPLSHVCVWDADIGYKRISLESACKMYPNGASAIYKTDGKGSIPGF